MHFNQINIFWCFIGHFKGAVASFRRCCQGGKVAAAVKSDAGSCLAKTTKFNNWLFGQDDESLFLDYNLDEVPAMAYKREKLWEMSENANDLTINEKRELKGYDARDEADVILVSATQIPLSMDIGTEEDEEAIEEEDNAAIDDLVTSGLSEEEAQEAIGLPPDQKQVSPPVAQGAIESTLTNVEELL